MQCKHTWYALGFRNQNLRHGETTPILGESTPPSRGQWSHPFWPIPGVPVVDVIWYCSYCPLASTYLVTSSATLHRHSCYWAFAAFSCSALRCSSKQTAFVATDAVEPDVPPKVMYLIDFLYRKMVSILTNNIAFTFYMSPMRSDIFWWGLSSTSLFLRASCLIQGMWDSTNNNLT
jgi:hypothetical protein